MPRPTWHQRVKSAIMELGEDYGYEAQSGIVYYKLGRNRFEYHPDVLWLYNDGNRFKPSAFVWEIESRWANLKYVCGDCILAFMMLPDFTTFFKQKEKTAYGRVLKKNVTIPTYYGGKRATYYEDFHKVINLNATHMILVTEHVGYETYWQRYIHGISSTIQFKGTCDAVSVPRSCVSVDDVRHRLAHLKFLRQVI